MIRRVPFGDLKIGPLARAKIAAALDRNWVSEGENVREFEKKFATKFGWKHAIATSSGTDAGIVVWSAVRELGGLEWSQGSVFTPASAFAATANCLLASGVKPFFVDVSLGTLNMDLAELDRFVNPGKNDIEAILKIVEREFLGIQFVANMGKPTSAMLIALLAKTHGLGIIGDFCEGHGAGFIVDESEKLGAPGPRFFNRFQYADHYCDAAIYSFFTAHMIVAGEGGMICTDDDEIAALCRSIKCHGYRPGPRFDFQRVGFNSKMNELTAAIGLEGLEKFDETFARRRKVRAKLIDHLSRFEDRLILYRDAPGEVIAPHAFPIVLRDPAADIMPLYRHLEESGVQCKTLFGSLPTQHGAFKFLSHKLGDFPIAERIGRTGLHFSCSEYLTDEDIDYIAERVKDGLKESC